MSKAARFFILAALIACLTEGAARKWVLPTSLQAVAYFAKDAFAVLFIASRSMAVRSRERRQLTTWIAIAAVVLIPAAVAGLTNYPVGVLLTLKNALLWPLVGVYLATIAQKDLDRLSPYLFSFAVLSFALGFAQALSSPDAPINAYAWDVYGQTEKSTFGSDNLVRATGTFSYLSGLANFAAAAFVFMLWRYFVSPSRSTRWLCSLGCLTALGCGIVSGSRTPVAYAGFSLLLGAFLGGQFKMFTRLVALLVVIGGAGLVLSDRPILASWLDRVETAGDRPSDRIFGEGIVLVDEIVGNPLGVGLGSSSQAVSFRAGQMSTAEDARIRLVRETGLAGVVLMLTTAGLVLRPMRQAWRSRLQTARIGVGVIGIPALYAVTAGLWYDHVASCLWWLLIGVWAGSIPHFAPAFSRMRARSMQLKPPALHPIA